MSGKRVREKEWQSWGIQPNSSMTHQLGINCPYCDYYQRQKDMYRYVVGFCNDEKYRKPTYPGAGLFVNFRRAGVVVIECPKCFEKFFAHTSEELNHSIERYMRDNPEYLLIPGAYEDYLKMTKRRDGKQRKKRKRNG